MENLNNMGQEHIFFILEGRNGATYIINAKNKKNINQSLLFYKARSTKQKIFKNAFLLFLISFSALRFSKFTNIFKSTLEIDEYLGKLTSVTIPFSNNSSILISSTRDKIIVNNNHYFLKLAFSSSFYNVKKELAVYKKLSGEKKHFLISSVSSPRIEDEVCSFEMHTPSRPKKSQKVTVTPDLLIEPLVEFFLHSDSNQINVVNYADNLFNKLSKLTFIKSGPINKIQKKLQSVTKRTCPLGLVHGDFKPWNILPETPIVFFDFEEAVFEGLPLEDLLNYVIDPDIRYKSCEMMALIIFQEKNISSYRKYLNLLKININFKVFLYIYLLSRVEFWASKSQSDTAICYLNLLLFIDKSEYAINANEI